MRRGWRGRTRRWCEEKEEKEDCKDTERMIMANAGGAGGEDASVGHCEDEKKAEVEREDGDRKKKKRMSGETWKGGSRQKSGGAGGKDDSVGHSEDG